jgi:hypothetical protein
MKTIPYCNLPEKGSFLGISRSKASIAIRVVAFIVAESVSWLAICGVNIVVLLRPPTGLMFFPSSRMNCYAVVTVLTRDAPDIWPDG